MEPLLQDVIAESIRALFLICGPCLLAVSLVGILAGALQTVTGIHEAVISYILKLMALCGLLFMFFVPMRDGLVALFVRAFKGS